MTPGRAARRARRGGLLLLAGTLLSACGEPAPRPHVFLISIDTLRRDHLPFYGYERDTAPRLGELAGEALVFEDAISVNPNTGPAHATMLTGLYPPQHGIVRNLYRLRPGIRTLAAELGRDGYATAGFVSGHTLSDRLTGLGNGFDVWDDDFDGGRERPGRVTWLRARRWLRERDPAEPVFVFFHLFDPHAPYRPPEEYALRFGADGTLPRPIDGGDLERIRAGQPRPGEIEDQVRLYDGEIAYADNFVGRLLDLLRERGFYDRSVILFTSDHGETLGRRPHAFDHGARLYEEQIRIPLVLRLPGAEYGGLRISGLAQQLDVSPTVLDLLGMRPWASEGRSLRALWEDGAAPGEDAYSFARPVAARIPEVKAAVADRLLLVSLRRPPLKLILYPTREGGWAPQLFDLEGDPGEVRDLAEERPERVAELGAALSTFLGSVGDLEPAEPEVSEEDIERLRALGYVQ